MRPPYVCLLLGYRNGLRTRSLQDGLRPGLIAEYFKDIDAPSSGFPDIPLPSYRRIESQISVNYDVNSDALASIPLPNTFYVRWMGVIKIPQCRHYKLGVDRRYPL